MSDISMELRPLPATAFPDVRAQLHADALFYRLRRISMRVYKSLCLLLLAGCSQPCFVEERSQLLEDA
ncbi:MAG: hypothetical protein QNJ78_06640 [Gammaproteobacteria bacterium]|nr:hypothetical protein [Gammaproteobacteria bacterium]